MDGKLITSRGENLIVRIKPPRLPDVSDVIAAIQSQEPFSERKACRTRSVPQNFGAEDAKRFYDRLGAWQDAQFYERAALRHLVAHSDFEHASAVFELGCGTGRLAECLFKNYLAENASYVGIDITTTMAKIATRCLALWRSRATVKQADGTVKPPYPNRVFDRFVATYVFDLLPEPTINNMLSEAQRLLRPKGKLCVVSSTEGVKLVSRILSIWKRIYRFNPRLVGGCIPLRVSTLLDRAAGRIEHTHVVYSWGISSEIVIASPVIEINTRKPLERK